LIHWQGMTEAEATWGDASWVQATFPSFKPWGLASRGEHCQDPPVSEAEDSSSVNQRSRWRASDGYPALPSLNPFSR
jgi:hypothetical protein